MHSSAHVVAPPNRGTNNHTEWDENVACSSPHAAPIRLSDKELEPKRRELQQLARTSFAWRAFTYFIGCFACQTFWTAVAIYALTRSVTDLPDWFLSAAAYSGAAVLMSVLYGSGQERALDPTGKKPGCTNCGK